MDSKWDFNELTPTTFEKLAATVVGDRFKIPQLQLFADGRDGGRDAAAHIVSMKLGDKTLENQHLVIQAKHTKKVDGKVDSSVLKNVFLAEADKVKRLIQEKQLDIYVVVTNYSLPAEQDKKMALEFRKAGVNKLYIVGKETLELWIKESRYLCRELPRLYNIGRPSTYDMVEHNGKVNEEVRNLLVEMKDEVAKLSEQREEGEKQDLQIIYQRDATKSDKIPQEVFSDLSKEQGLMKNWKFVGRRLKVDDGCLDEIEDHHKYLSERSYNMLLAWQEKFGGDVHVLMKALRKENLNRLAELLPDMLQKSG